MADSREDLLNKIYDWRNALRCTLHDDDFRMTLAKAAWKLDCEMSGVLRANPNTDGFSETRAQLDELAQQAEGSHRQHMGKCDG